MERPDLKVIIGHLTLANPVMTASGTCGYGLELAEWMDIFSLGALVLKGLSLEPRAGNPPPRTAETPAGLLNSIGLENIGIHRFIEEVLPKLREKGAALVANVYATSVEEFVLACDLLEDTGGIAALELNLSCPNVKHGGMAFGQDPLQAAEVVDAVRRATVLPLMAKLTPKVSDIAIPARACQDAGADALSVPNTFPGLAIDIGKRRPSLGGNFGGLSGPAIKPMALKLVWETCQAVRIPVIGMGGIMDWRDAVEFIIAGATAVQVGTATLLDPAAAVNIINGIERFMDEEKIRNLNELRGTLRLNG